MIRRFTILFVLSVLLSLLVTPVSAQEGEAASEPAALPTPMPVLDGPVVQAVLFFSPTCGHCHKVITETLPPLFEQYGGMPVTSYDQTIPPEDVAFYLMSNGQLQILFVDVSVSDGQAMFTADSVRLGIDEPGVPRLDLPDLYLVGSGDIPDQFPDILARGLAGEGVAWAPVPGLERALAPFIEMGAVADASGTPDAGASPDASASPGPDATEAAEA
jgi:thiol-disulfide isomerase/thioredoxin